MLLIASDSESLRQRWGNALADSGMALTRVLVGELAARLADSTVEVCLYDLGEQAEPDQSRLQDVLPIFPQVSFVALAAAPQVRQGIALLQAGVRGYCNRLISPALMPVVVQTVQAGELWVGRDIARHLLGAPPAATPVAGDEPLAGLTPREREIALMVGDGLSNKAIAHRSGITERTVKAHLNAIFRKTGIRNRVQLALAAAPAQGGRRAAHA